MADEDQPTATYYTIERSAENGLRQTTEELHRMFLNATDYVISHQSELGKHFRIPEKLWPKIMKSWYKRRYDIVSGRFDFALTSEGVKAYEYNADSASCLMECGYVQDQWAKAAGLGDMGSSVSSTLFFQLIETWERRKVEGVLHLMCDQDGEEIYHSTYMKTAAEAAGISCKLIVGLDDLKWSSDGMVLDKDNVLITNVWKTWSWQTALVRNIKYNTLFCKNIVEPQ